MAVGVRLPRLGGGSVLFVRLHRTPCMTPSRKWIKWVSAGLVVVMLFVLFDMPAAEIVASFDMTRGAPSSAVEIRSVMFVGVWRVAVAPKASAGVASPTVYWILPLLHVIIAKV